MKRQEKGRGKLDIRVLFTLAAIAEILGTLLIGNAAHGAAGKLAARSD